MKRRGIARMGIAAAVVTAALGLGAGPASAACDTFTCGTTRGTGLATAGSVAPASPGLAVAVTKTANAYPGDPYLPPSPIRPGYGILTVQ